MDAFAAFALTDLVSRRPQNQPYLELAPTPDLPLGGLRTGRGHTGRRPTALGPAVDGPGPGG